MERLRKRSAREGNRRLTRGMHERPGLIEEQELDELLSRPLDTLQFKGVAKAFRDKIMKALARGKEMRLETVGDLAKFVSLEYKINGLGKKGIEAIKSELDGLGLLSIGGNIHRPTVDLMEAGLLSRNLSYGQLYTLIRLAKLELAELKDDLQPHRYKVIGELLGLLRIPGEQDYRQLDDEAFSEVVDEVMRERGLKDEGELLKKEPAISAELERRRAEHGVIS